MDYQPISINRVENNTRFVKCVGISSLILSIGINIFGFLTIEYLHGIANGLEHANFTELVDIFEGFKECVERSHICSPH